MTKALILSGISIRQDSEGRYCLNDLHKAAGNKPSQKPSEWLRNQQIKELIQEISFDKAGIPAIQSRQKLGTFVIKDLVYAYAMWINAEFHLKVIRAYDALVTKTQSPEQIYLTIANELRFALPGLRITDQAVLLSNNNGIRNLSGETREQCQYYKKMDEYGLPGIIVTEKKPYKVLFDWFNHHYHNETVTDSVYEALQARCRSYEGLPYIGSRKKLVPFQKKSCCEEVSGIKSLEEAKSIASDLGKIVANALSARINSTYLQNRSLSKQTESTP